MAATVFDRVFGAENIAKDRNVGIVFPRRDVTVCVHMLM